MNHRRLFSRNWNLVLAVACAIAAAACAADPRSPSGSGGAGGEMGGSTGNGGSGTGGSGQGGATTAGGASGGSGTASGGSGAGGSEKGGSVGAGGDSSGGASGGGGEGSGGVSGTGGVGGGSGGGGDQGDVAMGGSSGDASVSCTSDGDCPSDSGVEPEIDGGAMDAGLQTCTAATVDPCASIPALGGTQIVDGKDDEFCGVPSFVFDKAAASKTGIVNNYNGLKDEEFASVKARVAWSSAGLHAFFDVTDAKVESVTMADPNQALTAPYLGDSVELFISANDTATGAPGSDSGAVHVTLAATGKSVSVTTANNNGLSTTNTELPAAQYAQAKTDSGYAIEVLIPWKDGSPTSGTKVRFDLALNIADDTFGSVSDMRDAQLIYTIATVGGQTSCPGAPEPYCDDRTWCSTTLQ